MSFNYDCSFNLIQNEGRWKEAAVFASFRARRSVKSKEEIKNNNEPSDISQFYSLLHAQDASTLLCF